jgi:hypothetical protein
MLSRLLKVRALRELSLIASSVQLMSDLWETVPQVPWVQEAEPLT